VAVTAADKVVDNERYPIAIWIGHETSKHKIAGQQESARQAGAVLTCKDHKQSYGATDTQPGGGRDQRRCKDHENIYSAYQVKLV